MKSIEERFAEVERRVRALVAENGRLNKRLKDLERALADARQEGQEMQHFHGKRMHVREKIEKILDALEAAGKE